MAARLRHGGKFSLKSLIFGHFFVKKCLKSFQLQGGFAFDAIIVVNEDYQEAPKPRS